MLISRRIQIFLAGLFLLLTVAYYFSDSAVHQTSDVSVEPLLRRASGACLARIVELKEADERPSDGDHYIEVRLNIEESTGEVPKRIRLIIDYGGMRSFEDYKKISTEKETQVLRHDSLNVGEKHWFLFSEDYDSSRYPYQIAGWWKYRNRDVPYDVVEAVRQDRFADHPVWDKTLNVVSSWEQLGSEMWIKVREADSLSPDSILFEKKLKGKLESLNLAHWVNSYELEWPQGKESHFVELVTIGTLPNNNEYHLPAGSYRINYLFELQSGKRIAIWIAKNQEIWLMHAFRQFDLNTDQVVTAMDFSLLSSGGIEAGGDTDYWYRRTVKKYVDGRLDSEQVFRHPTIKKGTERIYSGSGWVPVLKEPAS